MWVGSSGDMDRRAHQDNGVGDGERGAGSGSIGASCKYDSNSSGSTTVALYSASSQLAISGVPLPAPRSPRCASPTSHSSTCAGCANETPNLASFRAGNVKSGSAVRGGEQRRPNPHCELGLGKDVYAGQARPRRSDQEAPQREEVVVLSLVPHPVPSEPAQQVLEQPGGTFDRSLGEVFVLEPAGDRG